MKRMILALALAFCLALGLSMPCDARAVDGAEIPQGALSGLAIAPDGSLLVCDSFHKLLWQIGGGSARPYAGTIPPPDDHGEPRGYLRDGPQLDGACFGEPWDVVPFLGGYAVSDAAARAVRLIQGGQVYTLSAAENGSVNWSRPTGMTLDDQGRLYVADTGAHCIRVIAPDGKVSAFASGLNSPTGLAWHEGALYVVETGRSRILRITPAGTEVFAGQSEETQMPGEYTGGYADGPISGVRFDHPLGIAVGSDGAVYVADTGNHALRVLRDGRAYTLARDGEDGGMPVQPRGLLLRGDLLLAADGFAGNVLALPLRAGPQWFADVPENAWYAGSVRAAVARGLTGGVDDTHFAPEDAVTRGTFVTFLARLYRIHNGTAVIDGDSVFADLPEDAWYSAPARWAASWGIIFGDGALFHPEDPLTRESMVTMLYRYAAAQGMNVSSLDDLTVYPDFAQISVWALPAMRWAAGLRLLGSGGGPLEPGRTATRAEVVGMLIAFMDAYGL